MDEDKCSPLIESEGEQAISELDSQLWRVFWSFYRWIEECQKNSSNISLRGVEVAVLHTIRQNNKSKNHYELKRCLNRQDDRNIRYSVKRLLKYQLIERVSPRNNKKNISFAITKKGIKITDNYALARKQALIPLLRYQNDNINLIDIANKLQRVKSIYEEAAWTVGTYA